MTTTQRKIILRLYITGQTANSRTAMENLRKIIDEELLSMYELQVIDVSSSLSCPKSTRSWRLPP